MKWKIRNNQIFVITPCLSGRPTEKFLDVAFKLECFTREIIGILEWHSRYGGPASKYAEPVLHEYISLLCEHLGRLTARVADMRDQIENVNLERIEILMALMRSDAAELVELSSERWGAQCRQRTGVVKAAYVADMYETCAHLIQEFADLEKEFVELLDLWRADISFAGGIA